MHKRPIIWHLFPSYLLITVLSIVALTFLTTGEIRAFYLKELTIDLEKRAHLFAEDIQKDLLYNNHQNIDQTCKQLGAKTSTRITVVLTDGTVIGDSDANPAEMENHANRKEIKDALNGLPSSVIRKSTTLRTQLMYFAVPIYESGNIIGVVRLSVPLTTINNALSRIYRQILMGSLIIIAAVSIIVYFVSKRISTPLIELNEGAKRFAQGQLDKKIYVDASLEIESLAESMNLMASQLAERIKTVINERNEKEIILSSMIEGVLGIDKDEKIIHMNRAASQFLSIQQSSVKGKYLNELVRNPELHDIVKEALSTSSTIEKDILIRGEQNRYIRAQCAPLSDCDGNTIGTLLIMNDVTRLHELENVRRDFVANVSHELRTPITSIRGFIETVLNNLSENPEESKKFLEIALRQVDNLNSIIEDLLKLARIEREAERDEIVFEPESIIDILKSAILTCELEASQKNIRLELLCDPSIEANVNHQLMEQAVVNLITNAIRYSDDNKTVIIGAIQKEDGVDIFVKDQGYGIPEEHIPRLFERFYRVDKARDRKTGGTGLGLAIVKHIAQAHGGTVSAKSKVGVGSEFTIHIPLNRQ